MGTSGSTCTLITAQHCAFDSCEIDGPPETLPDLHGFCVMIQPSTAAVG